MVADIRDPMQCAEIISDTVATFGGIDTLVNNAGVGMLLVSESFNRTPPKFWDVQPEIWAQIIETNVNGGFQMAREAVPHMLEKGWGRIVNVTTSIQTMQRAGYSPYGPSKAALETSSSCWAEDLEGTGVTCNILIPGGAADTNLLPGNPGRRRPDRCRWYAGLPRRHAGTDKMAGIDTDPTAGTANGLSGACGMAACLQMRRRKACSAPAGFGDRA